MALSIRHSRIDDYDKMLAIYARARDFMRETGNPRQWNTTWPPAELIKQDIEGGENSFVIVDEEDEVVATFFFLMGHDPTYDIIHDGEWKTNSPYGVVHRLASSGKVKGCGEFCLNWAYEQCKENGRTFRFDTHADNKVLQNLAKKLGFEYCGIIYVREDNDPRYAYEKL